MRHSFRITEEKKRQEDTKPYKYSMKHLIGELLRVRGSEQNDQTREDTDPSSDGK